MVFVYYTYNSLGYITNVKKNGTTIATYSYDGLGQLVGETVNNQIYIYSYDKAGNITKKHVYTGDIGNLTDTINYTYSTSAWGDLLTNYDGTAITYDSIGNPTNWRNSSSLTWNGRTLISQTLTNGNSITYKYNSDGIRTQKRVFDDVASAYITHDYVLDGTKILSETVTDAAYGNSYTLYYVYDANGSITGLHYNGTPYYFQKSIQGDVLRICNASGAVVVEYTYDAWGNFLSVTGSMASTLGQYNPFRYRGYYYDSETGLYYLNSRYYDPQVGRFINADGIIGANGGIVGYNMFAYCNNSPVMCVDPSGYTSEYKPYDGSLEGLILWYYECYWYAKDNFGFVGDIDVGFYDSGYGGYVSQDAFIQAMENVGLKAPPVLITRYYDIIASRKEADYNTNGYYTSVDVQIGNFTIQGGVIVTSEDGLAFTLSPGFTSSSGIGVGASIGSSNASNNAAFSGTAIYAGRSLDVGNFSGSLNVGSSLDNRYTYNSIGVMWGKSFNLTPIPEQASISYTFVIDLN